MNGSYALLEHDSGEDAAAVNTKTAGREEAFVEGVGAERGDVNGGNRDTDGKQVVGIGAPEVDMPTERGVEKVRMGCGIHSGSLKGDILHREMGGGESIVDFVAYLKGIWPDAWADDGTDIGGTRAVAGLHGGKGERSDAGYGAAPTRMDGSNGGRRGVIEENGNTIGGGDAYTGARQAGKEGIDAVKERGGNRR